MIFDWDDLHETNHRLDLLGQLREANPAFRCTVFAVPGCGSDPFWESLPDWVELAVHGWVHPDPYECVNWTRQDMERLLDEPVVQKHFACGFKAPGWQISDDCYQVLLERGWWVADQPYNDSRRPKGLLTHRVGGPDHWHGHIQNDCGNGLEETFGHVLSLVRDADSFEFISEAVTPWT